MTRVEDFRFLMTGQTAEIVDLVVAERGRQEAKGAEKRAAGYDWRTCADPAMPGGDGVKLAVLGEEVGEVAKTICDEAAGEYAAGPIENRARALEHRLEELVQVAAVAIAWAEAVHAEIEGWAS